MEHVISQDGTPIAYACSGVGPPLALIHGTDIDHTQWTALIPTLEQYFRVYAVDRRGRGQSGDAEPYAIEREFDDVAALIDSITGAVNVVGHSYGAICSLEAAMRTSNIDKMALYEPPIYTTVEESYPPDILTTTNSLLKAGKTEQVLLMLYELAQTPAEELNLMRSLPSWQARVSAAHTITREFFGAKNYAFDTERFKDLGTPTLLLVGGRSTPFYKAAIETLHKSLPNSQTAVLSGQGHEAMDTAPELFLREVISFFRGSNSSAR
jgi:pimeloyl-ACP methyl ester carboxylesterase